MFFVFMKNRDFFYTNIYNVVKSASLLCAHNLIPISAICNLFVIVLFSRFLLSITRIIQESAFNEDGLRNWRDTREEK
jgi:hypothetical protein